MGSLELGTLCLCALSVRGLVNTAPGLLVLTLAAVWLQHISLLVLLDWDPEGGNGAHQLTPLQTLIFKLIRSEACLNRI